MDWRDIQLAHLIVNVIGNFLWPEKYFQFKFSTIESELV